MGYDRSPESVAALHAVTGILGDRLGRLTVATVAPFGDVRESERKHEELLRHLVTDVPGYHLRLEILHGHPATALRERAASGSYGLLALGTRGRGLATAIVGSSADSLASESTTPVLLVGGSERLVDVTVRGTEDANSVA